MLEFECVCIIVYESVCMYLCVSVISVCPCVYVQASQAGDTCYVFYVKIECNTTTFRVCLTIPSNLQLNTHCPYAIDKLLPYLLKEC